MAPIRQISCIAIGNHYLAAAQILTLENLQDIEAAFRRNFEDYESTAEDCCEEGDCNDMNPAHIIRECLTEPWGLGYTDSDIDDDAFMSAADALYNEGMGISLLWDREVERVCRRHPVPH